MKKTVIIAALSLFSLAGIARHSPKWAPEKGYWVVETNAHQSQSSIVYFYNNNNELVYKETLEGVVINLNKRRVKMNFKKVLDQSVLAYDAQHKTRENQSLVAISYFAAQ